MEILPIVKMAAEALAVAIAVLAAGALAFRKIKPLWRALMPLALAAGFIAGYALVFDFPHGTPNRPWYSDEAWKMAVVAVIAAGILLTIARMLPRNVGILVLATAAVAVTLIVVRTKWDDWHYYAAGLWAALLAYLVALIPSEREERLRFVAPVVLWLCATVAGVAVSACYDHLKCGRMLVLTAVLAGLAIVAGFIRPIRGIATGAGPFLAMTFGAVMTYGIYSKPDELPLTPFLLMALAPLAAGVAWIPPLHRRPGWCLMVAFAVAALLLIPLVWMTALNLPTMDQ